MRRIVRVLGITITAGLGLSPLTAATAAAPGRVTVTIVGIDRSGSQVAVRSEVVPLSGNAVPSSGPTFTLVPGTYYVGASVPTMPGGSLVSQTLVLRRVDVTASGTIKLDARGGKLVTVWLDGRNLGSPAMAGGCLGRGRGVVYPDPPAARLYVRPVRAAGIGFDWAVTAPGPGNSTDNLAGGTDSGVPANPAFHIRSSELAKTIIEARSGTLPDTAANWSTSSTESDGCMLPGASGSGVLPMRAVDYRTPGAWATTLTSRHGTHTCSMTGRSQVLAAGHSYTVSFANAAHGPSTAVPVVTGTRLVFNPSYQFADPLAQGYEYCAVSTVSLSRGGRTLKTQRFSDLLQVFSATVHTGWYVLRVSSRQSAPGAALPPGLLSPRTLLTWRFKVAQGAVPVAVMSFLPSGLDTANRAAPRSVTSVRVWPTQSRFVDPPGRASTPRSLSVQVSYDSGKTWHAVTTARHKRYWVFSVHNPASGTVSFRSVTVSRSGDRSTETIYQAYAIR